MSTSILIAHITGRPDAQGPVEVNVRPGPGADNIRFTPKFRVLSGLRGLRVISVRPDANNATLNGKTFQWFELQFLDGRTGWVRDDLLQIEGDGAAFGYPNLALATYAFNLIRQQAQPAPVPPAPPAPVIPGPAPLPVPVQPAPAPAPTPTAQVIGTVIGRNGVNLRDTPSSAGRVVGLLMARSKVTIVGARPQGGTSNHFWAEVDSGVGHGWVRTDFLSITGDGSRFGLSRGDEFPSPLKTYWWVRGHNDNHNPDEASHLGWDFGINENEPLTCGPTGGTVVSVLRCTRCQPGKSNVLSQNISLNDPAVFSDPGWGFGYGNAVIVRYDNSSLPASTRERLAAQGLEGAHIFVLYGHLSSLTVSEGQTLSSAAALGACGNTGNSTAPHLHLEVRASTNPNARWFEMRRAVLDPSILFLR